MLEVGMKAPEFSLLNQDGKEVSLSDFKRKKVVLYLHYYQTLRRKSFRHTMYGKKKICMERNLWES